jgi:hypothetical protein
MLDIELAESFLLTEPVELGRDDPGGALVSAGLVNCNGTVGYWNCLNTSPSDLARIAG